MQKIPEDSHIIGFKCDTETDEDYLINLSLLLGKIGKPGITGELRFPAMEAYPTLSQYKEFEQQGVFPTLSGIDIKYV